MTETEPWITQLENEWDANQCVVCGGSKWKFFPFCRSCTIRAQRMNIMKELRGVAGMKSAEIASLEASQLLQWAKLYDRARDYLIVSGRESE